MDSSKTIVGSCRLRKLTIVTHGHMNRTRGWVGSITPMLHLITISLDSHHLIRNCNTFQTSDPNPCLDPSLYVPNTFTPNGDGKNESFRPVITSPPECWLFWEFQIYNRWGNVIFESDYPGQPWTGNVDSSIHYVSDGVYVWKLKADIVMVRCMKNKVMLVSSDDFYNF